MDDDTTPGGLPIRAALHPSEGLYLALKRIPPAEMVDPFLNETVARIDAPEEIVHIPAADLGLATNSAPSGLIFSVGRSGSTLLVQLLRRHLATAVYAEPQVLNEILVPPHKWGRRELVGALRSVGETFARHARGPYILKASSWNTLFCGMLTEAFPATPWVFNVRDPLEVGVSVLADLPGWYRADQENARQLSNIVDPTHASRSAEEYVARAFGALCDAIGRLDPAHGRLMFYDELPDAAWSKVGPHFGMTVSDAERQAMADAAKLYSKSRLDNPTAFTPDAAAKQVSASPALRRAVDAFARPALERLRNRVRPN